MDIWYIILIVILSMIILGNGIYIFGLRSSIKEIAIELDEKLKTDTNTLITISSSNKYIKKICEEINRNLSTLRKEHLKLEHGNAELKQAITNVSHDLRTPLTAIRGYVELMRQEDTTENIKRYLTIISERTEAMCGLTEELFQFSMINDKFDNLKAEVICINDVIEECLSGFYYTFTHKKILPNINFPEQKVFRVLDGAALGRIFDNILGNVAKYSTGDLEITLTTSGTITFTNSTKELDLVTANRLFNRFYTVETATGSTGLGLSIARLLTEKMNGSIIAEYNNKKLSIIIKFPLEQ